MGTGAAFGIYFVMIAVCILVLITMIVHITNNTILDNSTKTWFVAALLAIIAASASELVVTYFESSGVYYPIHPYITALEFCCTPLFSIFLSFAFKVKRPAYIILGIELVHIILEIVLLPSGLIFHISETGAYIRGSLYFIYLTAYLTSYIYLIFLFMLVNRSFRNRDMRTMIMIGITAFSALIPSALNSSIRTAYLGATVLAVLIYVYYEDLMEQNTQAQIKAHSEYMSRELIQTLSSALEAKDEYTKGHSLRVAEYAKIIAAKMNYDEEAVSKLHFAATLHDIGKIGIPDTVLNKPGRLSSDEYDIIKMHSSIGADILKNVEALAYADEVARYHHERYDGKGYPQGLKGEEIPEDARIVAISDTFDAMTSKRIYRRNAFTDEEVYAEIERNKGLQFDPEITDVFLEAFKNGDFEAIRSSKGTGLIINGDFNFKNINEELDTVIKAIIGDEAGTSISIDSIIKAVEQLGHYDGALATEYKEFTKLFNYISNICKRYNPTCFLILVTLDPGLTTQITDADLSTATEALDIAIKQTIRTTDICTKFSKSQYLIVLVEAGKDNVDEIMKRIFATFYKIQGRSNLTPKYEFGRIQND